MGESLKIFKYLQVRQEERIIKIYLNNPPVNALSSALMQELKSVLDWAVDNKEVNLLIITAEGKFFSAGADIKELKELSEKDLKSRKSFILSNNAILNKIENFPKPVVAFINGYALGGGCELALACHLRFASLEAKIGLPEINLGVIPGWGGTWRLPRLVSMSEALEMILTGKIISAEEALKIGFVDKIMVPQELLKERDDFAKILVDWSVRKYAGQNAIADIFAELLGGENAKEKINAFLNKEVKGK